MPLLTRNPQPSFRTRCKWKYVWYHSVHAAENNWLKLKTKIMNLMIKVTVTVPWVRFWLSEILRIDQHSQATESLVESIAWRTTVKTKLLHTLSHTQILNYFSVLVHTGVNSPLTYNCQLSFMFRSSGCFFPFHFGVTKKHSIIKFSIEHSQNTRCITVEPFMKDHSDENPCLKITFFVFSFCCCCCCCCFY